jgi:hypothetical protein
MMKQYAPKRHLLHTRFSYATNLDDRLREATLGKANPRKGERGLAKAPVTVWVHEGSLKIEHQAVTLSQYTVESADDRKHLQKVSNPRLVETPFRSPQLTLWTLGPDDWLLYWRTPDSAPVRRRHRVPGIVQVPLFELSPLDRAVGADTGRDAAHPRTHLHLVRESTESQGTEE